MLILNGEESYTDGSNIGDRRRPVIFNPEDGSFKILSAWADDDGDRGYHNFALLLKDGRILLGGGRELVQDAKTGMDMHRIGCEKPDLRIYSPPYLYDGIRPNLNVQEPLKMKTSSSLPMEIPYAGPPLKARGGAVLMALPSETHHFDQNQRQVILKYEIKGGKIKIQSPNSGLIAPVGNYTLYLVSDKNIPSQGVSVHLE